MATEIQATKDTGEPLTTKVVKGGSWMLLTRLLTRLVGFGVSMVLARLLAPSAYGLVAVGILTISLLQVFTEVGFQQSLIQKPEDIEPLLGTAWTVGVIRGIVISVAMFLLAPWIAQFFELPEATRIVQALSLHPLIHSLTNIHIVLFQKELDFFKQFIYELSALAGNLTVGIGLALLWQNAWALVFGQLASVAIQVVTSYLLFPVLPRVEVDFSSARDLYSFGKWVFVSGVVSYIAMKGDTYFVGKLFDEKVLGIYTLAYRIASMPVDELKSSLAKVLFPTYAKIQDSPQRLKRAFVTSYELVSMFMLPATVGLALVSVDFVPVVLGSKWEEMIPVLQILGFGAAVRALVAAGSGFAYGAGKPHINFYQSLASSSVLLASLSYLSIQWGIIGVGWAVLFANLVSFVVGVVYFSSQLDIDLKYWMLGLVPIGASLLLMVLCVLTLQSVLEQGWLRLLLSCLVGGLVYIAGVTLVGHLLKRGSISFLLKLLSRVVKLIRFDNLSKARY